MCVHKDTRPRINVNCRSILGARFSDRGRPRPCLPLSPSQRAHLSSSSPKVRDSVVCEPRAASRLPIHEPGRRVMVREGRTLIDLNPRLALFVICIANNARTRSLPLTPRMCPFPFHLTSEPIASRLTGTPPSVSKPSACGCKRGTRPSCDEEAAQL